MWTDNPVADFHRHDAYKEAKRERLPECSCCGERIQDEYLYLIDGTILCEDCLNDMYRKDVEVFME